jgi:preprotein translocase subunit SecE
MARQTRAQRRARRAQRAAPTDSQPIARPQVAARQPVRTPAPEAPRAERHFPGAQFIAESWGELKKVEWPTQSQIIQATVVVLIACAIVGVYLWAADLVFKPLVREVFLK